MKLEDYTPDTTSEACASEEPKSKVQAFKDNLDPEALPCALTKEEEEEERKKNFKDHYSAMCKRISVSDASEEPKMPMTEKYLRGMIQEAYENDKATPDPTPKGKTSEIYDAYEFEERFEKSIIAKLLKDEKFFFKYRNLIKESHFEDLNRKDIFRLMVEHYDKYNESPAYEIMRNEINKLLLSKMKCDDDMKSIYFAVLDEIWEIKLDEKDDPYYADELLTFVRNQETKILIKGIAEKLKKGADPNEIIKKADEEIQTIKSLNPEKDPDSFSRGEGRSLFEILSSPEKEPSYLVKPWMVAGEKGYLTADKKVGKTFDLADLCLHLAIGDIDWLGFHIPKPVKVLSIRFELADWKFDKRLKRMMTGLTKAGLHSNVIQKVPVFEFVRGFEITLQKDLDWLFKMIDRHEPEVLELDPLYKMTGLNLSDPSKGPLVIRANEKISERYPDLHRLTAHHNKKRQSNQSKNDFDSDSNSSYGVFQIFADMDYQIRISSDGKEDPTFRWSFESNDEPVPGFPFKRDNETFLHYRVDSAPSDKLKNFDEEFVEFIRKHKDRNEGRAPSYGQVTENMPKRKLNEARKLASHKGWREIKTKIGSITRITFDVAEEENEPK